jgi:two-component system, NtrC family, sensor kinase
MRLSIKTKLIILFLSIITLALALVSYKGLNYFKQDKETYVQDLNVQNVSVLSNFLAARIDTLGKIMLTFAEFVDYRFADAKTKEEAQKEFLLKFRDFLSISVFRGSVGSLNEVFSVYDTQGLKLAMVSRDDITPKQELMRIMENAKPGAIKLKSIVKQSNYPILIVSIKRPNGDLILASVLQKTLFNIISEKEIYTAFVFDEETGDLVMHQSPKSLLIDKDVSSHPMVRELMSDRERRFMSRTKEYFDQVAGEDVVGSGAHVGNTGFGLVVQIPKRMAYMAAQELLKKLSIWIVAIFSVAVVITLVFSSTITKPLKSLANFASKVGKGEFNAELPKSSNDELGELVEAFNKMNVELKDRDAKIDEKNKQLVQSEKLSAFGQMSAGIAHEVKNPLAGILGYAQIARKKAPPEAAGLANYLEIIEKETKRCKEIVENLMKFARAEKATFADTNITQVVRDAVALVDHQVSISGNKIERKFDPDAQGPIIFGNANQITQVLTNLMMNANYAMKKKEKGGTLTIEVMSPKDGFVSFSVKDSGTGIAKENIPKLFEPFFTTKPAGEGTGLGLSVSYGIVKDHKGEIKVESELGQWTKFTISLPLKQT